MDKYYFELLKQFKEANYNVDAEESSMLIGEFYDWLEARKKLGEKYLKLLDYLKLERYKEPTTIEIGKGKEDSLLEPFKSIIISPYFSGLKASQSRILEAEFEVDKSGYPVAITPNHKKHRIDVIYDLLFMTQNPYSYDSLTNWENLPQKGNNFVVGVYGFNYDKDKDKKLDELTKLRDKLSPSTLRTYEVFDDGYFYALSSIEKPYAKVLTKSYAHNKR